MSRPPPAVALAAVLLLLACARVSDAARPIRPLASQVTGAPAALTKDETCATPGSCGAAVDDGEEDESDYDDASGDDGDYDSADGEGDYDSDDGEGANDGYGDDEGYNDDEDSSDDDYGSGGGSNLSRSPDRLYEALIEHYAPDGHGPSSVMQHHLERVHLAAAYPDAIPATRALTGVYGDGTPAGSAQWIGDHGEQDPANPTYATFGRLLDVSARTGYPTPGGAAFGAKLPWLASLVHREALVGAGDVPCRVDLLDDGDAAHPRCLLGHRLEGFVSVRANDQTLRRDEHLAHEFGIAARGTFLAGDVMELDFQGEKFDTIVANGVLDALDKWADETTQPTMDDMDLVLARLKGLLAPGGVIYLIGTEPWEKAEGPGAVYAELRDVLDSVKSLSGEYPKRNLSAQWVGRKLADLGLDVVSSTLFPVEHSYDDMADTISEAKEWLDELGTAREGHAVKLPEGVTKGYYQMLIDVEERAAEATRDGPVFAGERAYVIAATYDPSSSSERPTVAAPALYQPQEKYRVDTSPVVEPLQAHRLAPGEFHEHRWGNDDPYDGFGARVGIPPELVTTVTAYVKDLGLWDLMIDTVYNDPMEPDSTRFYNLTSPYGDGGRNFTWSAKRPGNFKGSSSDMHWFDISDEAAHEDSLRALSKGGYDTVLNAIGTYLGMEHLTTFSIGLLAVTKAEKGYVHVDFSESGKRAFNFLFNLQTPGDEPELTVIEEDVLGNWRRGQVKYSSEFGVLNGDDGMHATNECDHRPTKGVRITASIFLAELRPESVEEVAGHDHYYFPFGNQDWIWAQRGRHWNKEGTVNMTIDKGRQPFEAKDAMQNCKRRVGPNKEKCTENTPERKLCFKTCGTFMPEDKFQPGEERRNVFGW